MTTTPSTVVCYVYTNPETGEQTHYRPADITVVTLHAGGSNIEGAATEGGAPTGVHGGPGCTDHGDCDCGQPGPRATPLPEDHR